ncbi:MAG: hypothetical protein V9G12_02105 [Microthrixaceae bacterium]
MRWAVAESGVTNAELAHRTGANALPLAPRPARIAVVSRWGAGSVIVNLR